MTIHIIHGEIVTDEAYLPVPEERKTEKQVMRELINLQIDAFIARGGQVQAVPIGESGDDWTPVRNRREQIKWANRRFQINNKAKDFTPR